MDTFFMVLALVASALLTLASIVGGVFGLDPSIRLELIQFGMLSLLAFWLTANRSAEQDCR